jgi:transposase
MSRGRHATPVKLAKKERQELLSLIGRKTAAQRDVMRARIAILAHEGHSNTMIAQELGVSVQTVSLWRKRIARQGVQGIREGERSGRPARIAQETRLQLIALACEAQEAEGRVTPTLDEIVVRAVERGVVGHISRSHVQRILQAGDIRPHRVQQWLLSPDPAFREKVNVICKLYRRAPRNAVVLSIDEKTGIQAIERKYPGRAPGPRRLRRREFEYIRHGTQALIAALDVHTGQVLGSCRERRTQDDLVAFMESVAHAYPGKQVHVIWDNRSTRGMVSGFTSTSPLCMPAGSIRSNYGLPSTPAGCCAMPATPAPRICASAPSSLFASAIRQRAPSNGPSGAIRCKLAHLDVELAMPTLTAKHHASELQRQLRALLGHDQIVTQAYGAHLLIKRLDDQDPIVVARLSELGRNLYGAAFRSHSGRWEPLPGSGPLDEMAQLVVTLLEPYLQPDNY